MFLYFSKVLGGGSIMSYKSLKTLDDYSQLGGRWCLFGYSTFLIDLFTVYDALLAGGQTRLKLQ